MVFSLVYICIALYYCIIIAIVTGIVSLLLFIVVRNFHFIYVKGFDNFVRELKCQYKHLMCVFVGVCGKKHHLH